MIGDIYYVYVLRLTNGGFYVGSTKNLEIRLRSHFNSGGAIATKESKPVYIVEILTLVDYQIGGDYAHSIIEILVANNYAENYGYHLVRGAKHGMGWKDHPTKNGLRIIKRLQKFSKTTECEKLREKVSKIDFNNFPEQVKGYFNSDNRSGDSQASKNAQL